MSTLQTTRTPTPLDLDQLRQRVLGAVVAPWDDDWDDVRQAWNVAFDQRPALVVQPETVGDVQQVMAFAATHELRVAPQSTGHNAMALGDDLADTLLVRMDRMRGVTVDPVGRRFRAQGGAWWGDVTAVVAPLGLAALAGSSPDVGVVGYTLGGGISWLGRRHGLAANSVLAIEVVTADGALVRCDHSTEPGLFWALRGGGGSFGVVTAIEMALYPLPEVLAGALFFPWERAREVLQAWATWTHDVPDALTSIGRMLQFPPIPDVPEPLRGGRFAVVEVAWLGDARSGDELVAPLRALGPTIDTIAMVPPDGLARLHMDPEGPTPGIGGTRMLRALPGAAVDALVDAVGPGSGSPLLSVEIRHLGGALGRSAPRHGALERLAGDYLAFGVGVPVVPELVAPIEASLAAMQAALAPWGTETQYLNFVEEPAHASTFHDEGALARLRSVKAAVDPSERLRANHPIRAAA
ncbi:FAD-binding oxidoreductase [Salsipaludibacter albus]|uniref:FAD-binding oxidoreductase n=1 Tax=Salsipaludibacter albus TaxID=2849650 RepID=UPI001EE431C1|nr:FAD-binding oxidoreductase [Salsipaludibacter albus]MBY5163943.1 FAD-binding oxidoreductase [Salsipaludibacter albus]